MGRNEQGRDLTGAVGVAGFIVAAIGSTAFGSIFDFPPTGASSAEIAAFVSDQRSAGLAAMLVNTAAVTLWLAFGAGVWLRLRRAAGGETFGTACFGFGLVAFITLIFAGFTPFLVLTYRNGAGADARLLYDVTFGLLAMSGAPTALALGAYAATVYRLRELPLWTAGLAALGSAAHVVLLGSFLVTEGFFSLEGEVIAAIPATLFAWILGTGIAMLRTPPASPPAPRTRAA